MSRQSIGPMPGWLATCALAGVLLGAATLVVPSAVEAQEPPLTSTERTFLSNENLTGGVSSSFLSNSGTNVSGTMAQAFTTGGLTDNDGMNVDIVLRKITLWFPSNTPSNVSSSDLSVEIWRNNATTDEPLNRYFTLTNPSSVGGGGAKVFTYANTSGLGANTTYHIVVRYNRADRLPSINRTSGADRADASESLSGWSVGAFRRGDGSSRTVANDHRLRFKMEGVRGPVAAIGEPTVTPTGTPRVGTALTAGLGDVADRNGLPEDYTWKWQWAAAQDAADASWTDIASAMANAYTPVTGDAGRHLRSVVSFTDADGYAESRASGGTLAVNHSPAGGPPAIVGTVKVGETLTLSAAGVTDGDGPATLVFNYLWRRADVASGEGGLFISGTSSQTYTLTTDDAGKYIQGVVLYTDGAGKAEGIETAYTKVENSDPTGGPPTIMGTAIKVGETLTAAHGTITDADGPNPLILSYQWRRADNASGGSAADIAGETSLTYVLTTADAGSYIQFVVSYTDGGGKDEVLATAWTRVENSDPVGEPTISGTVKVGEEVTVVTTGITDADGPATLTFGYRWLRADDSAGTTGVVSVGVIDAKSLTLTTADAGKYIQATVLYRDGGGTFTFLETAWTKVENSDPVGKPTISGTLDSGETVTAVTAGISDRDGPATLAFTGYQWRRADDAAGAQGLADLGTDASQLLTRDEVDKYIQVVVSYTDGGGKRESVESDWVVVPNTNNDPTGGPPTITGTARVGQQLTVVTTGISDPDGPATLTFAYQWRRADDAAGTANAADIPNTDSVSYTLTADDAGKYIQIVASYTDGGGVDESIESAWTEVLNSNPVGGPPTITGMARVGQELTAAPGAITDADGGVPANAEDFTYQWRRADDATGTANAVDIPSTDSVSYTLAAADAGKYIQVVVSYTDGGGADERFESAWREVLNSAPAGGLPSITGTVRVRQDLTADTTGITDVDGPATLPFEYQWRRADNAAGTAGAEDIPGETSSTYTLTAADLGKYIQVVVSYTDGGGTDESLQSGWVGAVGEAPAAPDTAAMGNVTVDGGASPQVGVQLSADTTGITDPVNGLTAPNWRYQWQSADDAAGTGATDITGATSQTYTPVAGDDGKLLRVEVTFTDDDGYEGTKTSVWTGSVLAFTLEAMTGTAVEPAFEASAATANQLVFTVTPSRAPDQTVTLAYSLGGTATVDLDYTAMPETLSFPSGSTAPQTITVSAIGDIVAEDSSGETVTVTAGGATVSGTINEPDGQAAITTSVPTPSTANGMTTVSFDIIVDPTPTSALDVEWRMSVGGNAGSASATGACTVASCSGTARLAPNTRTVRVDAEFSTELASGTELQVQVKPPANHAVIPAADVEDEVEDRVWVVAGEGTVASESSAALLHAVAGAGHSVAAGIVDGIWSRGAARRSGSMTSQATLGGKTLDTGALSSGDASRTVREVASLLGIDATAPDGVYDGLDGGYGGGADDYRVWAGIPDRSRLASQSSFALTAVDGAGRGKAAFWGEFSTSARDSETEDGGSVETESSGILLGFDMTGSEHVLYGLVVSRSSGESEFRDASTATATASTAETSLLTFAPYLYWSDASGKSLWAGVGMGSGSLEMALDGSESETDVGMTMLAAGARSASTRRSSGEFALKGDAYRTEISADGTAGFDELSAEATRIRVALERVSARTTDSGAASSNRLELGARIDSGDGEDGAGADVAAELSYASPGGLEVTARLRTLLLHSQEGFSEWGVGIGVAYSSGDGGRGASLSLEPTWNVPSTGVAESMWGARDLDGYTSSNAGAAVKARLGYGAGTLGDRALATLYGETETGNDGRRLRIGAEMRGLAGTLERLSLDVYGEREEKQSPYPDHSIMLEGRLGF